MAQPPVAGLRRILCRLLTAIHASARRAAFIHLPADWGRRADVRWILQGLPAPLAASGFPGTDQVRSATAAAQASADGDVMALKVSAEAHSPPRRGGEDAPLGR